MDADILEMLACPDAHHAPLTFDSGSQALTCSECRLTFPIRDGIPVLLLDEATRADPLPPTNEEQSQ